MHITCLSEKMGWFGDKWVDPWGLITLFVVKLIAK